MKSEKITQISEGEATKRRRSYGDACAAAHAMEILGERWALLVVRELITGPKRFSDIRAGLPGISANVLTQRLEGLEAAAVLTRQALPPPASGHVYALTNWGREAEPIFQALGRWAARSPTHDVSAAFSTASLVMSLRTMFDRARTGGRRARVALLLGRERYVADAGPDGIEVEHDEGKADVTLKGDPRTIVACLYGGQPLEVMEAAGALTVTGDRAVWDFFRTLFPLPATAPSAEALATALTEVET